jgi:hypothetical protein
MHPDSERLARYICGQSADARVGGETFPTVAISAALNMTKEDLDLAANELEEQGLIRVHRSMGSPDVLMAEAELFRRFDRSVKGWDPEDDALTLARTVAQNQGGSATSDVAKALGWAPRRINPACEVLTARDSRCARKYTGVSPFTYGNLVATDSIRRLARDG